ncbi:MAG: peptide-methionine (R)-S-oxide reductase MsrB [Bacteroidetes bacterium]|nr:peptide-methionine (R)-S-oxide reductase MsrB [Bacteroidota bacterium]MBS1941666.1 peptide-methionine (R)-S-oxide reductase MsrB [Bacteroidota bacterium]
MARFHSILPLAALIVACTSATSSPQMAEQTPASTTHGNNPYYSRTDTTPLHVSDAEWKRILPDSVFEVARHADTERAFTGKYWNFEGLGTYYCAVCGNALFRSDSKFASSCGWPSFYQALRPNSVRYQEDHSYGMDRTEVLCGRCGSHLGHIFDDGPPPTGKRFCMNSIVLDFVPDGGK